MKRIYACLCIVAVLLSIAFYSSWRVQKFAEDISDDIDDAVEAERVVSDLMGDQVEPRKEFIQKHARDVRFLDI